MQFRDVKIKYCRLTRANKLKELKTEWNIALIRTDKMQNEYKIETTKRHSISGELYGQSAKMKI